ncbi:hypothetical protein PFICI_10188 [Pestalotiopsis fici W106-1]|uniref:Mid2 domain-containing protein n=1 Tax=Pestalotiopsis fici (strain W106-1 / CGMCC3.15140) TaxID=1229662 RepID=W3WZ10_PESFW|nr:uncharacterized protein PFICI_10188 [Pestalotiopsis fici W106-1]ETS78126.1 hypothetical protein PFICI_10188 [Pestalotiopsis fici W106-1]
MLVTMTWRWILLATISILVDRCVSSHVQNGIVSSVISQDQTGPRAWVTVAANGEATTIVPSLTTTDGTTSTISPPPPELTQTAVWTLTISGATTTTTGINPVATVSGLGQEGSFLLCENYQGEHAPMCQPEDGSSLDPGPVYYVTWNAMYFASDNASVQVEGTFADGEGFASEAIPATLGFYTWNTTGISQKLASDKSFLEVSLSLITLDTNGSNTASRQQGPTVMFSSPRSHGSSNRRIDVLTVVLPSILGVTILVIMCAICVIRRKRASLPGWLTRLFTAPPPPRYNHSPPRVITFDTKPPRIDSAIPRYELQLTNRDSWSATSLGREPHPGRNVFREEMMRQNRQRG